MVRGACTPEPAIGMTDMARCSKCRVMLSRLAFALSRSRVCEETSRVLATYFANGGSSLFTYAVLAEWS